MAVLPTSPQLGRIQLPQRNCRHSRCSRFTKRLRQLWSEDLDTLVGLEPKRRPKDGGLRHVFGKDRWR